MYERFTDRSRIVMQLANQEAQRLRHEYIGTEHILLGLVSEGTGVAANVLKNLGIDPTRVREEVQKIVLPGPHPAVKEKTSQTPRAKKVIEYAMEESRHLNHNYVGTEHLLLGLLREEEGVAAQVLMNLGLDLVSVRDEVLNLLGQNTANSTVKPRMPPEELIEAPPMVTLAVAALDRLLDILQQLKETAIVQSDFERAANLRDRTDDLKKLRVWLLQRKDHERGLRDSGSAEFQ